jgi:hypothetical protein
LILIACCNIKNLKVVKHFDLNSLARLMRIVNTAPRATNEKALVMIFAVIYAHMILYLSEDILKSK